MDLVDLVRNGFEAYRSFNENYPILGAMATAEVIFPVSDIASQLIMDKKVDWRKVGYTAALALGYGAAAHACVRSGEVIVGKYVSSHALVKAALGPNLWGNVLNAFFFMNNTVGERTGYNLSELVQHYGRTVKSVFNKGWQGLKEDFLGYIPKKEYFKAFLGSVTIWNAFQWYNYTSIPQELQTPSTLGMALCWTILLSAWSLNGGRKVISSRHRSQQWEP